MKSKISFSTFLALIFYSLQPTFLPISLNKLKKYFKKIMFAGSVEIYYRTQISFDKTFAFSKSAKNNRLNFKFRWNNDFKKVVLIMSFLFDKFKRDNFWGPFWKTSVGTTKFPIHLYYSENMTKVRQQQQ